MGVEILEYDVKTDMSYINVDTLIFATCIIEEFSHIFLAIVPHKKNLHMYFISMYKLKF